MQTIPSIRKIRRKPQRVARHTGGTKGQSQISPLASCTDGFLNHRFMPLCEPGKELPEQVRTETEFFKSADSLCQVHGFAQAGFKAMPYPYNILLTYRDLETKLNRQPYDNELYITRGWLDHAVTLATKQVYEVGNTLYYIPVIPLFLFLRHRENKASGMLLLAVMSYLYREAGIPYYRDEGNFINGEYEMNKEYFLECVNENPDEYEEDISDIIRNDICGDIMQRKIHNRYHLDNFTKTVECFKPQNAFDEECLLVAKEALALYLEFPNSSVFQHIDEPEDWDEVAIPESYVSFIGDGKGWVYETIERQINDYLGNFSEMLLPTCVQVFDGTTIEHKTLEFEYRLFELITDLCNILFELP
ncbi:hypothetical protein [Mucilaginibacter gossypii]|uniref:Uncharacterized protein n=1 Tax=Mucilaginibacter gossypii TaxID=551996 RepID=A0A1G8B8F4_9SPHI|nr:hypothetical protein [Mucilaginibacter gossypii]SDH29448.1 hypothetical protein SAMN05192573_108136 [Mucilaginibacter gossypii]